MKMESLHTYTNHDSKKGALEELKKEETAPTDDHRPSAPPEVPKQNIQFFDKLQQAQSNIIRKDGENKKIKTKREAGKAASYSNVKRSNKEGGLRKGEEDQRKEGKNEGDGDGVNLRETVGGYEEMTEENQTVSIFGPQTVWEKSHLNQQLD